MLRLAAPLSEADPADLASLPCCGRCLADREEVMTDEVITSGGTN